MSETLNRVFVLCAQGETRILDHGYDELAEDGIFARDMITNVGEAIVIEDYPDYPKSPCVLILQKDRDGAPIRMVLVIPKNADSPAVVITAYRPDSGK